MIAEDQPADNIWFLGIDEIVYNHSPPTYDPRVVLKQNNLQRKEPPVPEPSKEQTFLKRIMSAKQSYHRPRRTLQRLQSATISNP